MLYSIVWAYQSYTVTGKEAGFRKKKQGLKKRSRFKRSKSKTVVKNHLCKSDSKQTFSKGLLTVR